MPYYSDDIIRQVIEANDIVDVISQYVPLKQKGNSYSACCPFHQEKTPSFSVNTSGQYFHCFGCHESGNVISFIMKKENVTFPEALKILADRAGIELPVNTNDNKKAIEKDKIIKLNHLTGNYFYKNLKTNKEALGYLVDRGINVKIIQTFGLGYAPNGWSELTNYLKKNNIPMELAEKAGLIKVGKKNSHYDIFRNRLIIPIQDVMNKVIGFGGRKINEKDKGPKYLNTPDTLVFNKKNQLFNLNRAKSELKDKPLILVEGYMDVIALYNYGIKNVAAALGTAFTSGHTNLISRYTKNIILCFDGDSAGEKATERAINILKDSELNIKVIRLPVEHDPDSYIRENGTAAFYNQIDNAITDKDFTLNQIEKKYDLSNRNDLIDYLDECCTVLSKFNSIEQSLYARDIAKKTNIEFEAIEKRINELSVNKTKKDINSNSNNLVTNPIPLERKERESVTPKRFKEAQMFYLTYCLEHPEFIPESKITEFMLSGNFFRWLFIRLKDLNKENPTIEELLGKNSTDNIRLKLNKFIELKENYKSSIELVIDSVKEIKHNYRKNEIAKLESDLNKAETENQDNLFNQMIELKKMDWAKL